MSDKFAKEREVVLKAAEKGIEGNIPFSRLQNKYVKNLLLFALMNASTNETVTSKNFLKLVNKLFKGYFLKIIKLILDDDDGEFDEAIDVELNKIVADKSVIDIQKLVAELSPSEIIAFIKANTNGIKQKDLIKRILALRDLKSNHRETPQEERERKERQRQREIIRQRELTNQRVLTRGERSR